MNKKRDRRNVLKGLGGLVVASTAGTALKKSFATESHISEIGKVDNRPLPSQAGKIQAYAQKSVTAGGTIDFRINCPSPYNFSIKRLGWDTDGPSASDWTLQETSKLAVTQHVRPGSYIHVERALASTGTYQTITLECWVRLFNSVAAAPGESSWMGVITQHTHPNQCGYGMFISPDGKAHLYFGDGNTYNPAWTLSGQTSLLPANPANPPGPWHHIVSVFDNGVAKLYVNGILENQGTGFQPYVTPGVAPLRIGAYGNAEGTAQFMNGDIAMPIIYRKALTAQEIASRYAQATPQWPSKHDILGCWPLDEEQGDSVRDIGDYARTGLIVNRGTWMIGGPGFSASSIGRFDSMYDPKNDMNRGHALRFSAFDVYDCGWQVSHSFTMPNDAIPGIYVGRITINGVRQYDTTFVVTPANQSNREAPLLVVCSTSTWLAYNHNFGLFSLYHQHSSGQYSYQAGLNVPWSDISSAYSADPYAEYFRPRNNATALPESYKYSHLVRAERFLHVWLEQMGIGYDLVTDQMLDASPGLLSGYKAVLIAGHSEYWTKGACIAIKNHLASGGKLISASGNTMCWRVSYGNSVMECRRKLPGAGNSMYGEQYHEHDGVTGGSLREVDSPAWEITGLDTIGYGSDFSPYKVTNPNHPFFQFPEPVGIGEGMSIGGDFAVGHEYDTRLHEIPAGGSAAMPIRPLNYAPVVLAEARSGAGGPNSDVGKLYYDLEGSGQSGVMSEIIDWELSGTHKGRIFSIGSVNAARSLHDDSNMSKLFRNALHHLGLSERLTVLAVGADKKLHYKWFNGQDWMPSTASWEDFANETGEELCQHPPAAIQGSPGTLSSLAVSASGLLIYRYSTVSGWSGREVKGTGFKGKPAMLSYGRNRLQIIARDTNNQIKAMEWNGTSWLAWSDIGGPAKDDPVGVVWQGRHASIAYLNTDNKIIYRFRIGPDWSTPTDLGGDFASSPALFWWNGRLYIAGTTSDGNVKLKYWNLDHWSEWINLGGMIEGRVAIACSGHDELSIFGIGKTMPRANSQQARMAVIGLTPQSSQPVSWVDLGGDFTGIPSATSHKGFSVSVVITSKTKKVMFGLFDRQPWQGWQDIGGDMKDSPCILRSFSL